jgi:hypothetical protein
LFLFCLAIKRLFGLIKSGSLKKDENNYLKDVKQTRQFTAQLILKRSDGILSMVNEVFEEVELRSDLVLDVDLCTFWYTAVYNAVDDRHDEEEETGIESLGKQNKNKNEKRIRFGPGFFISESTRIFALR